MNKKDTIIKILEEMGYCPQVDEDNDVVFKFQLKTIFFSILSDDDPYQNLVFNSFYNFEEEDVVKMLVICNKINREIRHIKVVINENMNSLTALYQFILTDEETARANINMGLELFGAIRPYFESEVKRMAQSEEEDNSANNQNE